MPTLSVIIPAHNEEENIEAAVITIKSVIKRFFSDWELLVFNDGSTDRTGEIADQLANQDPKIKVIHHATAKNLGACYKEGIEIARHQYLIMLPGDNECGIDVMENIFKLVGKADIIIPYTSNGQVRPLGRRLLSRAFVAMINAISGNHLRYYNGAVLHKTSIIKKLAIKTDGFGYQAEALVKLIRRGYSYLEVATKINYRPNGTSKALRPDNVIKVAKFLSGLVVESWLNPRLQ